MKRMLALLLVVMTLLAALPALADGQAYNAYWIIPDGNTRLLTEAELWNYTRETLRYIRNELLARYGYAFEMEKFYDYFNAKPWYHAGGYGTTNNPNKTSWTNISTVRNVERAMDKLGTTNPGGIDITEIIAYQNSCGGFGNQISYGNYRGGGSGKTVAEASSSSNNSGSSSQKPTAKPATPQPNYIYNTQYIIPDSNTRALTENELWAYSRETLRYIRNELLARHGYIFGSNKFGRYFKTKSWYHEGGYENAILTSLEWQNVNLVKKVERAMDAMGTQNENYLDITTIIQNQNAGTCPGK